MHPNTGRKQSPEHIAKRMAAMAGKPRKPGAGRRANSPSEIWSKVDKRGPDECWPWKGWRNEQGYGRTEIKDVAYYAHRVIFDLVNPGVITLAAPKMNESGFIRHSCDNPPCCNPVHLLVGTHQDNMDDKVARGRSPKYPGATGPRCKLTEDDVRWIRFMKRFATKQALALLYDVSTATISGVLYGRTYQDID